MATCRRHQGDDREPDPVRSHPGSLVHPAGSGRIPQFRGRIASIGHRPLSRNPNHHRTGGSPVLGIAVRAKHEDPPPVTDRRSLVAPCLAAASVVLGVAYVVIVKPGVPYDEPSHWLNVLYFAHHHRIPTIGDPSVSYEAQQPPLAYAVAGLVVGLVHTVTSLRAAFYATRIVGGLEWLAAMVFAWRLLTRLLPDQECERQVAFAVLALNPMLLAMAWSVQNDSLALLLGIAALDYASVVGRDAMGAREGALLGAIVAAGVLTKLTDWALVAAVPLWLVAAPVGRRAWNAVLAFAGSVALVVWMVVPSQCGHVWRPARSRSGSGRVRGLRPLPARPGYTASSMQLRTSSPTSGSPPSTGGASCTPRAW